MYSYLVKPRRMGQRSDSPQDPIGSPDNKEKRLIAKFRDAIRSRHYSRQTEKTYWYWIRSYPLHKIALEMAVSVLCRSLSVVEHR